MRSPASPSLAIQDINPSRRVLIDGRSEGSGKTLESIVIGIDFEKTTCRVGTRSGEGKSRLVERLHDQRMRLNIRLKIYKHIRVWRQYADEGHQIGYSDSFWLVLMINLRIWWLFCTGGDIKLSYFHLDSNMRSMRDGVFVWLWWRKTSKLVGISSLRCRPWALSRNGYDPKDIAFF